MLYLRPIPDGACAAHPERFPFRALAPETKIHFLVSFLARLTEASLGPSLVAGEDPPPKFETNKEKCL